MEGIDLTRENKLFAGAFYTFFVSGSSAMLVGAIIPFIIGDYSISYDKAGILLSLFACGNLLASFVVPFLAHYIGRKKAIVLLSLGYGISYTTIVNASAYTILPAAFLLMGLGRGSISNINNAVVNDTAIGKSAPLNILHTFFAVGAFISPLLASVLIGMGLGWKTVVYAVIFFAFTLPVVYYGMDIPDYRKKGEKAEKGGEEFPFYKNMNFYLAGGILFFYLGAEAAMSGWVVTYLKDAGIMEVGYAQNILSLLWVVIIFGRLLTAFLSKKIKKTTLILIDASGALLLFLLFLATSDIRVITLSIIGFGFFFAGIYPTTIASIGKIIKGSNSAMALLLAIAGLGGMSVPFFAGVVADNIGISAGMTLITVSVACSVVFTMLFKVRNKDV